MIAENRGFADRQAPETNEPGQGILPDPKNAFYGKK